MFTYLADWRRTRQSRRLDDGHHPGPRGCGPIYVQARRGTTSHFNIGTPSNAVVFGVMGIGIVVQVLGERRRGRRALAPAVR